MYSKLRKAQPTSGPTIAPAALKHVALESLVRKEQRALDCGLCALIVGYTRYWSRCSYIAANNVSLAPRLQSCSGKGAL